MEEKNEIVRKSDIDTMFDYDVSRRQALAAIGGSVLALSTLPWMSRSLAFADGGVTPAGNVTSGNITLEVPTKMLYVVSPDGNAIASSGKTIKNLSNREVRVKEVKATAKSDFNLVKDADSTSQADAMSMNVGPDSDKLNLADYVNGGEVSDPLSWTMAIPSQNEKLASLELEGDAKLRNLSTPLTPNKSIHLASARWTFSTDTLTNAMLDALDDISSDVGVLEEEKEKLKQKKEEKKETVRELEEEITNIAISIVGPGQPTDNTELWIDSSAGGALKYKGSSGWQPGRYVWA